MRVEGPELVSTSPDRLTGILVTAQHGKPLPCARVTRRPVGDCLGDARDQVSKSAVSRDGVERALGRPALEIVSQHRCDPGVHWHVEARKTKSDAQEDVSAAPVRSACGLCGTDPGTDAGYARRRPRRRGDLLEMFRESISAADQPHEGQRREVACCFAGRARAREGVEGDPPGDRGAVGSVRRRKLGNRRSRLIDVPGLGQTPHVHKQSRQILVLDELGVTTGHRECCATLRCRLPCRSPDRHAEALRPFGGQSRRDPRIQRG